MKNALKKDLKAKFAGTLSQTVSVVDPKPSKKVKKIINKSSKQLASAVIVDTKKARKKAIKIEKKAAKDEKKALKAKIKEEKKQKPKVNKINKAKRKSESSEKPEAVKIVAEKANGVS